MTSCYVHNLLDEHRGPGTYTPREEPQKTSDKDPHGKSNANGIEVQHTESRLLTKKQLSDMAFGIRELSKKLSHVRLKLKIRNIFILTKAHDESLVVHTRELADWLLQRDASYTVWVEDKLEQDPQFDAKGLQAGGDGSFGGRLKYWDNELCHKRPNTFDIVLGVSATLG
jgi:NAD+ kinase